MSSPEQPFGAYVDRTAEYILDIAQTLGSEPLVQTPGNTVISPAEAPHTPHDIDTYVNRSPMRRSLRFGESIRIPTATRWTTFTKGHPAWVTDRDKQAYRDDLFADDRTGPGPLAGGEAYALAAGRCVLDIGSGEAVGLLQFSREYSGTTFVGIDCGYAETYPVDLTKTGAQLTCDDWNTLTSIPDTSIDTILSLRSVMLWGLDMADMAGSQRVVTNITRVAKPGAIWRFDMTSGDSTTQRFVTGLVCKAGWEITIVEPQNDPYIRTVVAIKQ